MKGLVMMWGYDGFGFMWMALFWIGLVLIIVWAVRPRESDAEVRSPALRILEDRFARGEMDLQEFESRRRELGRVVS